MRGFRLVSVWTLSFGVFVPRENMDEKMSQYFKKVWNDVDDIV